MGAWDAVAGVSLALLGSYVYFTARTFPNLAGGYPGPGLFPQLLGLLLAAAGVLLALGGLLRPRTQQRPIPAASRVEALRGLWVVLAVVLYIVLVDRLGFPLLSFLLLAGLMWVLGVPARWSLVAGGAVTLFLDLLFGRLLHVPLPRGPFP